MMVVKLNNPREFQGNANLGERQGLSYCYIRSGCLLGVNRIHRPQPDPQGFPKMP